MYRIWYHITEVQQVKRPFVETTATSFPTGSRKLLISRLRARIRPPEPRVWP